MGYESKSEREITSLDLNEETVGALKSARIATVRQLTSWTEEGLLDSEGDRPGLTQEKVTEIKEALRQEGLALSTSMPESIPGIE